MKEIKEKLDNKVNPDNLLDPEILKLSQKRDIEIVEEMKKQVKA